MAPNVLNLVTEEDLAQTLLDLLRTNATFRSDVAELLRHEANYGPLAQRRYAKAHRRMLEQMKADEAERQAYIATVPLADRPAWPVETAPEEAPQGAC